MPTTTARPTSREDLPALTRVAAGLGGVVSQLSRSLGRGGGSVVGGRAILAVDPAALRRLGAGCAIALVSGTNGKTTTTSLLRRALSTAGPVRSNVLGANLRPGLASALAAGPPGGMAALEVDEAWLGRVVDETGPVAVALLNLSRDQLDRYNEVRKLAASWRRTFAAAGATVVANADDPLVVWGAGLARRVRWVGAGQPWTDDAAGCPACGGRIRFAATATDTTAPTGPLTAGPLTAGRTADRGHTSSDSGRAPGGGAGPDSRGDPDTGGWWCGSCDLRRPPLDVHIDGDTVRGPGFGPLTLGLSLPGRANRANAAIALTVATVMGVDADVALAEMRRVSDVVGRYSTVPVGGTDARLLLAKNPAGWLEALDVLRPPPLPVVVAINARIADGRDPSWLWDVPFEGLAGRRVVATGERARDLAVRLRYAGVDHVCVPDLVESVTALGAPSVDVVANYTSFQALRARLGR